MDEVGCQKGILDCSGPISLLLSLEAALTGCHARPDVIKRAQPPSQQRIHMDKLTRMSVRA